MSYRLGAVTIGQAPRVDIVPELQVFLGADVEIVEAGALDGLSSEAVARLSPEPADQVLVTRMRDGTGVKVAGRHIIPRVQQRMDELAEQVGAILLLCTGTFPPFRSSRPVLYPERIMFALVRALGPGSHVGVLTPDALQIPEQRTRWLEVVPRVTVVPFSAYRKDDDLRAAIHPLNEVEVDLIVMDSLGYTLAMKEMVRRETRRPVLLARSVLARVAAELL